MSDSAPLGRFGQALRDFFIETPRPSAPAEASADPPAPELQPVSDLLTGQAPTFQETLPSGSGPVDFAAVYQQAGLSDPNRFSAEKALEMVRKFPAEMPLEMRRASARITLETMGKDLREPLTDAAEKLRALDAYLEAGEKEVAQVSAEADAEISQLQAKIQDWERVKEARKRQQQDLEAACEQHASELKEVVNFFTPDLPSSGAATPGG
ncbi:MAG TPA: hypothetical protein VGN26_08370 [Armatimonadota bacterium]